MHWLYQYAPTLLLVAVMIAGVIWLFVSSRRIDRMHPVDRLKYIGEEFGDGMKAAGFVRYSITIFAFDERGEAATFIETCGFGGGGGGGGRDRSSEQ